MKLKPILFYLVFCGSAVAHDSYQKEITPCQLIDSRLHSRYPETQPGSKPDGIHYDYPASWYRFPEGIAAAKAWGASVLNEIINSGI